MVGLLELPVDDLTRSELVTPGAATTETMEGRPTRGDGPMALVVTRASLHDVDDDIEYWLSQPPSARIAAVEVLRRRVFGESDYATGSRLQRVCRVVHRASTPGYGSIRSTPAESWRRSTTSASVSSA